MSAYPTRPPELLPCLERSVRREAAPEGIRKPAANRVVTADGDSAGVLRGKKKRTKEAFRMPTQGYAVEREVGTEKNSVAWKILGTHSGPPDTELKETIEVLTSDGWKTFSWTDIYMRRRSESIDGTLKRLKDTTKLPEIQIL
jgi:hypothetical protein